MPTWTHNGIEIALRDNVGDFVATPKGGARITAPSLDAMKKKLDVLKQSSFQPFNALHIKYPYNGRSGNESKGGFETNQVIGIEREKGRSGGTLKFQFKSGRNDQYAYPDTPENREAIQLFVKTQFENFEKREAMDAEERALKEAIQKIYAKDYAP